MLLSLSSVSAFYFFGSGRPSLPGDAAASIGAAAASESVDTHRLPRYGHSASTQNISASERASQPAGKQASVSWPAGRPAGQQLETAPLHL